MSTDGGHYDAAEISQMPQVPDSPATGGRVADEIVPALIQRLQVQPGDVLALVYKQRLTQDHMRLIREQLLERLKQRLGIEDVLIFDCDVRLAVISKNELEGSDAEG